MVRAENVDLSSTATELRIVVGKLINQLRAQGSRGELTWSQAAVIACLERNGPRTISQLARAEGVRSQSIGATVADLEAGKFVERRADPGDGRQVVISSTNAGRQALVKARAAKTEWLVNVIDAQLSPKEQRALGDLVELLRRLVEE